MWPFSRPLGAGLYRTLLEGQQKQVRWNVPRQNVSVWLFYRLPPTFVGENHTIRVVSAVLHGEITSLSLAGTIFVLKKDKEGVRGKGWRGLLIFPSSSTWKLSVDSSTTGADLCVIQTKYFFEL